ncbi:hypothetical protein D3C80_1763960 [compost metagenome]
MAASVLVMALQPATDQGHESGGVAGEALERNHCAIAHITQVQPLGTLLPDQLKIHLLCVAFELLRHHQLAFEEMGCQRLQLVHTSAAVMRLRPCRARTACWLNAK